MREVLTRRLRRLEQEPAPDLILLDGGKGQLNTVRAVLDDLALEGIELAAIAKERDEESPRARVMRHGGAKRERVFRPGVKDPLSLAPDSQGLLLLQRVRDESHRFAIRYHRELRRKSSLRSLLDQLPRIAPKKRRALLRGLGSLEGVRRASEAEIAQLPGISRANARVVWAFFHGAEPLRDDAEAPGPIKGETAPADGSE